MIIEKGIVDVLLMNFVVVFYINTEEVDLEPIDDDFGCRWRRFETT